MFTTSIVAVFKTSTTIPVLLATSSGDGSDTNSDGRENAETSFVEEEEEEESRIIFVTRTIEARTSAFVEQQHLFWNDLAESLLPVFVVVEVVVVTDFHLLLVLLKLVVVVGSILVDPLLLSLSLCCPLVIIVIIVVVVVDPAVC